MPRPFTTASVDDSLEILRRDRPAYAELIDFFGPLLRTRERLVAEFKTDCPELPAHSETARQQGVHLLAGNDLSAWEALLNRAAGELYPVLGKLLNISDMEALVRTHLEATGSGLAALVRLRLEGDEPALARIGESLGLPTPSLGFVLENILFPVLGALTSQLTEPATWGDWKQPSCPICGSLPAFAYLSLREPAHTEQLVSGGGRKYMHCGLCGHDWRVRRDACPGCGTAETEKRELLFAEETPRERIEACHSCNSYSLCIDLREYETPPALDTVPLGLLHLDILAQGKSLRPLAWSTWNTLR
ncbi:MAG: formate dehydrogenase accessory protein FdhE [Desulfovibrio sp.]